MAMSMPARHAFSTGFNASQPMANRPSDDADVVWLIGKRSEAKGSGYCQSAA